MTDQPPSLGDKLATDRTRLALNRTRLAHERTLMAWVRTAASLISFGFTIYKFFQLEIGNRANDSEPLFGPRLFALSMIFIGITALALAFVEHRRSNRTMVQLYGADIAPRSVAGIVAWLVSLLGLLAFVMVVLRQ